MPMKRSLSSRRASFITTSGSHGTVGFEGEHVGARHVLEDDGLAEGFVATRTRSDLVDGLLEVVNGVDVFDGSW